MDSKFNIGDDIFECKLCGECCKGFGGTYVTQQDIGNIAQYIHCNEDKFTGEYCDKSGSRFVLTLGENGCCVFFDPTKQCTIHPVKPYMCRAWPFLATIIKNPENWNTMANSCKGMKKDIPDSDLKKIVTKEKKRLDDSLG
jgi:uncharacterized protein